MGGSSLSSPFGATATSTFGQPATGFRPGGGFAQTAAAPAFGAGGGMFGAPAPAAGSMFSQQPAQSAFGIQQPSTGFTFGQPAAQPAAGNMFNSPAPIQSFGSGTTFGASQQFGASAPLGTAFLGSAPAFAAAPVFAQPAATSGFGGLGGGIGTSGGFGLTTAANPGVFGVAAPAAQPFGSFGAPAAATGFNSFSFGQPAAQSATGNIFAAPATTSGFAVPAATGGLSATPASIGAFGGLGCGLGLTAPAATSFSFGAPAAPAASPFGAFQAPGAAALNMFPGSTGFGQPAPAATSLGFGGFGGFGAAAPVAKPATSGFSALPSTTPAFGGFGSSFGSTMAQQSLLSAPTGVQQPLMQQPQCPPMDLRMDLLRTKRDELDVELKDARIYGLSGQQTGSMYSSTTFTIPKGMRPYKQTSRSAAKIVPRGLISSATMATMERPLSSVLSAASSGGSNVDLMSPEKLLGRSAKRLIITSNGLNGADPTIDLPLPSYQQQQQQQQQPSTQLAVSAQQDISPPRALMRDATSGQTRAFEITNSGDVTGLTPSATRSPFTPTSLRSTRAPSTGSSDIDYTDNAPLRATSMRMATPGPRQHNERESLDGGTDDDDDASSDIPNPPTLSKRGYITTPSMSALGRMSAVELSRVKNFSIYRPMHGKIEWEGETDVRGLDLDLIVTIEKKNVSVYDGEEAESVKPSVGMGLNKSAIIYLKDIFPSGSTGSNNHSDLQIDLFLEKLKRKCMSDGTEFLDYDTATGEWIFRVDHFSRYGLDDDDDDVVPPVVPVTAVAEKMPPIVLLAATPTPALGYLGVANSLSNTDNDNNVNTNRPILTMPFCTPRVAVSAVAREAIVAAEEARSHPFHLTEDSPCMRLLLEVKNKYIGLTGQSPAIRTILTKVSGNGAPINAVRQRHPIDMSLSMGRSFRVGWGPNGEIVHSGNLLFGSVDATFGQFHRVVVEKVNPLRWTEERAMSDFPVMSDVQATPHLMHSCEDSLKAILRHSFVFDRASNADIDAPESGAERGSKEPVVPLWRAPHAKPWELKEYLPYLNLLDDLQGAFDKRGLSKVHSDWAVGKAVELVSAVSGQEEGSYTEAKSLYSMIGNVIKLDKKKGWQEREDSLVERLEEVRESTDFMPLYEDRDSHLPIDWERRREAISAWLVNITTVEGTDVEACINLHFST